MKQKNTDYNRSIQSFVINFNPRPHSRFSHSHCIEEENTEYNTWIHIDDEQDELSFLSEKASQKGFFCGHTKYIILTFELSIKYHLHNEKLTRKEIMDQMKYLWGMSKI